MGVSGVPWVCDKSIIIRAMKRNRGVLSRAAKELDVDYITLKRRIDKNPDLIQLLADLRNSFSNELLDMAEGVLDYAMENKEEDVANALKSSFYVLNNKGRDRGYSADNNPKNQGKETLTLNITNFDSTKTVEVEEKKL